MIEGPIAPSIEKLQPQYRSPPSRDARERLRHERAIFATGGINDPSPVGHQCSSEAGQRRLRGPAIPRDPGESCCVNYRFNGKTRSLVFGNMRRERPFERRRDSRRSRSEGGRAKGASAASQLTPPLEVKVERANLTSDARKWQAVIKPGERELRRVPRRSEKRLSCSRPISGCLRHLVRFPPIKRKIDEPATSRKFAIRSFREVTAYLGYTRCAMSHVGMRV